MRLNLLYTKLAKTFCSTYHLSAILQSHKTIFNKHHAFIQINITKFLIIIYCTAYIIDPNKTFRILKGLNIPYSNYLILKVQLNTACGVQKHTGRILDDCHPPILKCITYLIMLFQVKGAS